MSHPQSRRVLLLMIFVLAIGLAVSMFFYWRERTQDRYWFVQPQAPMSFDFPMDRPGQKVSSVFWIVPGKFNPHLNRYGVIARFVFKRPEDVVPDLLEQVKLEFRVHVSRFDGVKWSPVVLYGEKPEKGESAVGDVYLSGDLSGKGSEDEKQVYIDLDVLDYKFEPGQYHASVELVKGDARLKGLDSRVVFDHIVYGK
ncbi:hypothetical protein KIF53_02815 [Chromobacterium subtsugae]|uniref:DUF5625 domain-containing protein n=1 Tax=Chromobacterium subtsugae TaxID=251747 RepID=A0ABS7F8Z5_9NEIS|nr:MULTISPECIES: hypothetical protein [Chromobacterium]MBW7564910.1 hypothetical protein [Chromobacterium subtsugae]MBW8286563.1 hypothetical protein [Chromobacterium subtsugae]WSE91395.1 hypothetical protein U6115_21385 [Chromobacterium subtsugae]WVH59770.1 hypothetical protein U6151_21415 [Chromobacterium subtsugae]